MPKSSRTQSAPASSPSERRRSSTRSAQPVRGTSGSLGPLAPVDAREGPIALEPLAERCFDKRIEPVLPRVAADPHPDARVVRLGRVYVGTTEHAGLVRRDDRVRERASQLDLLLVPAEVDEVSATVDTKGGCGEPS